MIFYVDIMLAIDFSMDFLALFICSVLLHLRLHKLRIILSASFGALYGVLQVLIDTSTLVTIIVSIFVAFLMILIAFPFKGISNVCFNTVIYVFVNTMLGGIMSILYSFLNRILGDVIENNSFEGKYGFARMFMIIALTAVAAMIFSKMLCSKKDVHTVEVRLKINDEVYAFTGMCDSGNLLTEPISGKKVILVSEFSKAGIEISKYNELLKKYIPYKNINGSGIIKGIVPKELLINGKSTNAIVATVKNESFDGYEALVPGGLE